MSASSYNRPDDLRGDIWAEHVRRELVAAGDRTYTCSIARSNNDRRRETVVCTNPRGSAIQIRIEDEDKKVMVASIFDTPMWLNRFADSLNQYYRGKIGIAGGRRKPSRRKTRRLRSKQNNTRRKNSRRI